MRKPVKLGPCPREGKPQSQRSPCAASARPVASPLPSMLEIRDLRKNYAGPEGEVRALDGVSLAVAAGEFIAVQGPSGCGKSTLLAVAGALLAPDAGTVRIAGGDPYALGADARARFRARHIGFVFQQFHLIPYLDVLENVLAPALAAPFADSEARARALIDRFGLTHRLRHVPAELSTGERQRAALARALLLRPRLLLADEPTGNLDQTSSEGVLRHLAEFAADGGAVLLVTHDPQAAAAARRVISLTTPA